MYTTNRWKITPKWAWLWSCDPFKFLFPVRSLERLKLETSDFVHWFAMSWFSTWITNYLIISRYGHSHVASNFLDISEMKQDKRYGYDSRLIGNHIWLIKWHNCQWPWGSQKVILCLKFFVMLRWNAAAAFDAADWLLNCHKRKWLQVVISLATMKKYFV